MRRRRDRMPPDKLTSANFGFLVAHDRLLEGVR
jgi:hypothetical protein